MSQINWDFVVRFLNITVIDLALSGDNAIVIGMAAAALKPAARRKAIAAGGGLAILLRIGLTAIASWLMLIPLISAIGALVLVWVVYKLVRPEPQEEAVDATAREASNFRDAIILIVTADFMMSLDNVIAVAGSAHGSFLLLALGLLLSMPLLMITGGVISALIERARWLVYVGAAAISFTAVRMFLGDGMVARWMAVSPKAELILAIAGAVLLPLALAGIPALARSRAGSPKP